MEIGPKCLIWAIMMAVSVSSGAQAEASIDTCSKSAEEVFSSLSGSVVQINSLSINPFLVADRIASRTGTGFVIEAGHILTNYHVVADADEVYVLEDDKILAAVVIGIDPSLDIALVETVPEKPNGESVEFAAPENLRIGQTAYALGYPFGIGKSISSGIVSGVSRVVPRTTSSWLSPFIQTDAAISPGNSGGPLVDDCGRVIGLITSMIIEFGAENIGFAIPIEVLEPVVASLMSDGYVSRPWHGIYGQTTTPLILQILGYEEDTWEDAMGFLVETVEPGSAADIGGLRGGSVPVLWGMTEMLLGGDIITKVNGTRIGNLETALQIVQSIEIGDRIQLEYLRDGEPRETSVVVGERPLLQQEIESYRYR